MSSSKKSFEPPLKRAALSSPSPTKLPEWYQKYSQEAFVHDNEFDETKIHSESNVTKLIENFDFKYLPEDIGTILRFLVVVGCVGGVF